MTTIRQIIIDAYRESGTIQIGTEPEAEQLDEALRKVQSIVLQLLGNEAGEGFDVVAYGTGNDVNAYGQDTDRKDYLDSYYVPSNVRLLANTSSAQTVYLDPAPTAGARFSVIDIAGSFGTSNFTIKANGRKIDGGTQAVLSTNGVNEQWFYRDDLAEWVKVTSLSVGSESPFPREFDELLILSLALRLNPRYQQTAAQESMLFLRQVKSQFRSRYRQTEFTPSDVSRLYGTGFDPIKTDVRFNRGLLS